MKLKPIVKNFLIAFSVITVISVFFIYFYNECEEWKNEIHLGFSSESIAQKDITFVNEKSITEYVEKYKKYRSDFHYNKLNAEGKFLYKILIYAYENNYPYIFIDAALLKNSDFPIKDIIVMCALDSPLIEQNIIRDGKVQEFTFEKYITVFKCKKTVVALPLTIESFTKEKQEKKIEAINKAENIKLDFSNCKEETEKAKLIYDYVCKNVVHIDYDENNVEEKNRNFLYDAMCKGKSNCDGFSNMLSLLYRINGFECYEKLYFADNEKEKENKKEKDIIETGHTWNMVLVDGIWYNSDADNGYKFICENNKEIDESDYFYFLFSDEFLGKTPKYNEIYEKCIHNYIGIDYEFETYKDKDIEKIPAFFHNNGCVSTAVIFNEIISQEKLDYIIDALKYDWNFEENIRCTCKIINNITILYFYAA